MNEPDDNLDDGGGECLGGAADVERRPDETKE